MTINYIKKHCINKKNMLLFLVIFLISLALIIATSICYTFLNLKHNLYNNNLRFRTLIVEKDDEKIISEIKKISHVQIVENSIYNHSLDTLVSDFDTDIKGEIIFFPILDKNVIKINNGRDIKSNNEIICSDIFYPFEIERKENKIIFNKNRILKPNTFIGKKIKISTEDENVVKLKIVGTYDSSKNNNYLNACYVTKELFSNIMPKYDGGTSYTDEDTGEIIFIPKEYTGKIVIVDSYKNILYVEDKLDKMNVNYYPSAELNSNYVLLITYTPILFSITILIIFSIILESFLTKKIKYNSKNYAILRTIGYEKRIIIKIDILENSLIYIISLILSTIIYIIIFLYIKNIKFAEYIYDGTIIKFSYIPIIINIVIVYLILFFIDKKILNKKLDGNMRGILK